MSSLLPLIISSLLTSFMIAPLMASAPNTPEAQRHFDNLRVEMRDGITLSTNVFFPKRSGPFPVILIRTPYDASGIKSADEWTEKGYAVVYQDTRGRFRSEGEDLPWVGETEDAEDTINWIVRQPWCDGNIGMYGGSYLAFTQVAAVQTGHPALKIIAPTIIGADRYFTSYWGGALRHGRLSRWLLRSPTDFDQAKLELSLIHISEPTRH